MNNRQIFQLGKPGLPSRIGNKAEKLLFLSKKGFQSPLSWVCTWDVYLRYLEDEQRTIDLLASELSERLTMDRGYAVRSSANTEDSLDHSFAGQFESVLNVQGMEGIVRAVRSVWEATDSHAVRSYLGRNGIDPADLRMAVIIQEMVPQVVSGVSFSKNPITGLDEVVVEAVKGSGEALVQDGVTPRRWINKWGGWISQPTDEEIGLDLIEEVVQQTRSIATAYGQPVDLEWVYDGHTVHWVQLREITSLDVDIYSNRISKEMFPGLIKPLIWSVNVPLVNGAWVRIFTELIGQNDIDPNNLARSFRYRAYFNMGAIGQILELLGLPRETLELLMGIEGGGSDRPSFKPTPKTYALLPRMLWFGARKLRFARKIEAFIPRMEREYQSFDLDQVSRLDERELLHEIDRLYPLTQRVAYYNILTPLLMQVYNAILKGQLARIGVDFEQFNLTRGMQALADFDPNVHLAELNRTYNELDAHLQARIRTSSYDQFRQLPGIESLQRDVERFLERFGHLSDSGNDFSAVPWRENPDLIITMMADYVEPAGGSETTLSFQDLEIPPLRRPFLRWIWMRARRFRLYREAVGSLYTFGYGLFRPYFLALDDHFARRGIIPSHEDIFYLRFDEIRDIVEDGATGDEYADKIFRRKREIDESRDIVPPSIVYGDQPVPPATESSDSLEGTPTSRGQYTGPVRVVRGLSEFGKLNDGDVLVIPYSDVGWTPLFTKAGAVVAESGGMLSHSSIIAREYGIPAVVSVNGACLLEDGTVVTVDGYRGSIVIRESARGDAGLTDSQALHAGPTTASEHEETE
jgi:pyruvate,water dikinase